MVKETEASVNIAGSEIDDIEQELLVLANEVLTEGDWSLVLWGLMLRALLESEAFELTRWKPRPRATYAAKRRDQRGAF